MYKNIRYTSRINKTRKVEEKTEEIKKKEGK